MQVDMKIKLIPDTLLNHLVTKQGYDEMKLVTKRMEDANNPDSIYSKRIKQKRVFYKKAEDFV